MASRFILGEKVEKKNKKSMSHFRRDMIRSTRNLNRIESMKKNKNKCFLVLIHSKRKQGRSRHKLSKEEELTEIAGAQSNSNLYGLAVQNEGEAKGAKFQVITSLINEVDFKDLFRVV